MNIISDKTIVKDGRFLTSQSELQKAHKERLLKWFRTKDPQACGQCKDVYEMKKCEILLMLKYLGIIPVNYNSQNYHKAALVAIMDHIELSKQQLDTIRIPRC